MVRSLVVASLVGAQTGCAVCAGVRHGSAAEELEVMALFHDGRVLAFEPLANERRIASAIDCREALVLHVGETYVDDDASLAFWEVPADDELQVDLIGIAEPSVDASGRWSLRWGEGGEVLQLTHAHTELIEHDGWTTQVRVSGRVCPDGTAGCPAEARLETIELVVDGPDLPTTIVGAREPFAGRFVTDEGEPLCDERLPTY